MLRKFLPVLSVEEIVVVVVVVVVAAVAHVSNHRPRMGNWDAAVTGAETLLSTPS